MNDNKTFYRWVDLPFKLDENKYGKLNEAIEEAPGVFYVNTVSLDDTAGREYYVVTPQATPAIISPEVAAFGIADSNVRIFEYTEPTDPFNLVKYEIMHYKAKHGLPIDEAEGSLYCAAVYNAEYFPWYFGGAIPPRNTPFGLTVRAKKVAEGLFFLETDQCHWVLAVSFPIWDTDLSKYTISLGRFCDDELSKKARESRYLFIPAELCATAVYELMRIDDYKGLMDFIHSKEAVETYLWEHFTPYAIEHNAWEISGGGASGFLENMLQSFGIPLPELSEDEEAEKEARRIKNCIQYVPTLSGQDFLLLPQ